MTCVQTQPDLRLSQRRTPDGDQYPAPRSQHDTRMSVDRALDRGSADQSSSSLAHRKCGGVPGGWRGRSVGPDAAPREGHSSFSREDVARLFSSSPGRLSSPGEFQGQPLSKASRSGRGGRSCLGSARETGGDLDEHEHISLTSVLYGAGNGPLSLGAPMKQSPDEAVGVD